MCSGGAMSTLKELIETSTDYNDYMVSRLWNQGNKVTLGPEANQFIKVLENKLESWLNEWDASQENIKSILIKLQNQAIKDLENINVPSEINPEMLKKGYMLAIAGQLAKNPKIIGILNDHTYRKNWPTIIKFIQSGDEGLQKRGEFKQSLEKNILTGLDLIKKEIHDAVSNIKTSLPYREIDEYADQKINAHSAANNVLYALKKLGVSASIIISKEEINSLKEQLNDNLKRLHDGFENLDPETAKDIMNFFRNNSDMISKAMDRTPARSRLTFRPTTSREDIQDLLDQCKNKAYARPVLELALLSIDAEHLNDGSVDRKVFIQQANESGLIGKEFIKAWEANSKDVSRISTQIQTTGKVQFGENTFNNARSAATVALFINQAIKNIDDDSLLKKLKKLPTIGIKLDRNWEKATSSEKKKILVTINDQANKIYGKELFNAAKNVVREKQPRQKTGRKRPAKWVSADTNSRKRLSTSSKRDSSKGHDF